MKKILLLCMSVFAVILCGCGKTETHAVTKMIDLTDYTASEVAEWANENDVASKLIYVYSVNADKPAGCVVSQSVEDGKPITDGVVITISSGVPLLAGSEAKTVIPNVIGKSFEDAKTELNALGLQIDTEYSPSSKEKDTVILSDPLPGVSVAKSSKVVLTLSSGKRESTVSIVLSIPSSTEDNTVTVYVDGELDRAKTVRLDPSVKTKTFIFSGTGIKEVRFSINNEVAAVYNIDFSSGDVSRID